MSFPLRVCADLYGQKVNLEIPFTHMPSLDELSHTIKEYFEYEGNLVKPPTAARRPFHVGKMQVYNDDSQRWEDLHRSEQLVPHSQIYCFQPNVPDIQSDLPGPRPPAKQGRPGVSSSPGYYQQPAPHTSYGGTSGGLPQPTGVAAHFAERPNIPVEEKTRVVFNELDANGKQFLDYGDLERGFKCRGLHFAVNTIGELFHKADLNRDGRIIYEEWANWCTVYPNTLDAMYYRGKDSGEEAQIKAQIEHLKDLNDADHLAAELLTDLLRRAGTPQQLANAVKSLNRHIQPAAQEVMADPSRDIRPNIQRALDDLNREAGQRDRQMPELEAQLRAAAERRHILEQQEMNLLEQEIRLERQRDAMRAQEAKYAEAEQMFNSKANETGSPRRARRVIGPGV